ncbi:MAG: DUF4276 family protein [Aureispira sp.]
MPTTITIAYFGEGSTDQRFLFPIIQRTFQNLVVDAAFEIRVSEPIYFGKSTKDIASQAESVEGFSVVCIHVDGDVNSYEEAYDYKYAPKAQQLDTNDTTIIPVIPIRTIEAWMLVDEATLLKKLQTTKMPFPLKSDVEKIGRPKEDLNKIIRAVQRTMPKKRQKVINIENLYTPLGNELPLDKLQRLSSYQKFQDAARQALIKANLLQS